MRKYLGSPSRDSGKEYFARVFFPTGAKDFMEILRLPRALKVCFAPKSIITI